MDTGHFLFLVAKDLTVRTHGPNAKNWPEENFYTYVSTIKMNIKLEHLPKLMKQYKVETLERFDSYFEITEDMKRDEEVDIQTPG